ncbi:hypothetical protein [Microbacterium murale]|uniref:Uncharacterized protein n=1 Tax=Microbacterium murale TaxID=1081040 RepID=A0ABU0P812_9MICO|nr:hypothetical protein [Microbacterium murale]MDQ0643458.1 hypothetical protein [Microbacterium murale]
MTTETTQVRTSRGAGLMLASTPLVLLVTHYLAVLPHEFTHSILAWALGIKENPWLIDWGGDSLLNILLLVHINENVDYHSALDAGKTFTVAVVALSGPVLANGGMFLIFRKLSTTAWVKARPFAAWIVFWFIVVNLGNLWCYIPIRAFAADGDFRHFIWATGASPWLLYVIVGYLVLWALIDFYRHVLPNALDTCGLLPTWPRAIVLVVSTCVIFAYFAIPGFLETDAVSLFIAGTSVMVIPPVILVTWRRVMATPRHVTDQASPVGALG